MKSRLMSRREIEALAETESVDGLLAALTKTDYRRHVEIALARASGMDSLMDALRQNIISTFAKVRRYYSDEVAEVINLALRTHDIDNLKAVLRGLSQNLPADVIAEALLPVGELNEPILKELARSPGPRAAIDTLASMRLPLAQPLMKLRAREPGAETPAMELALEHWHYQQAQEQLESAPDEAILLVTALEMDADLINLINVLRFVHARATGQLLREGSDKGKNGPPLVGPGTLSFEVLRRVSDQGSMELAIEALAGSPYEEPMRKGLEDFQESGLLSVFEKKLKQRRLRWLAGLFLKDPLGIGVILGYLSMKTNEVANLRRIAHGINLGLGAEAIKADLEFTA
jgi:V/A-type H+-transporting ATPase subunit C